MKKSNLNNGISHNGKNQKTGNVSKKCAIIIMAVMFPKITVVLKMPNRIGDRIIRVNGIHDKIDASTWLLNPDPTMANFALLITAFENAVTGVEVGVPNAEDIQNTAWSNLETACELLRLYVQITCRKNPANALEIAHSADMEIKSQGSINVQDFSVEALAGGNVKLRAKVIDTPSAHEWQCSLDPTDNAKWYTKIINPTLQGKTSASGFEPKTLVYFRHRTILKDGATAWSEIISVVIMK